MFRIWLCVLALFLASVGGSGFGPALSMGEACAQSCPDDDERGQCSPDCVDCTCCSHTRPVLMARPSPLLLSPTGALLPVDEVKKPLSVDTDDILHVPIAPLA